MKKVLSALLIMSAIFGASCSKKQTSVAEATPQQTIKKMTSMSSLSLGQMHNMALLIYKDKYGYTPTALDTIITRVVGISDSIMGTTTDVKAVVKVIVTESLALGIVDETLHPVSMHSGLLAMANSEPNADLRAAFVDIAKQLGSPDIVSYATNRLSLVRSNDPIIIQEKANFLDVMSNSVLMPYPPRMSSLQGGYADADAAGSCEGLQYALSTGTSIMYWSWWWAQCRSQMYACHNMND